MKTQTDALIIRNHYKQMCKTEAYEEAMRISKSVPHHFVHIWQITTTGMYVVDMLGDQYSYFKFEAKILNQQVNL